jgi:hypothetical protein
MKIASMCVAGFLTVTASAAEPVRTQEQLLSTLGCVMLAQKHVAAAALVRNRTPRQDAVIALAVTKLPNQTPEEALRDAERILDFVGRQSPLDGDKLSDDRFAACAKEKALPMAGPLTPHCWRLLPVLNEAMAARKKGTPKGQVLKSLKDSKGLENLQKLNWNAVVDRVFQWQRTTSEFSVGEVLTCGQ